MEWKELRSSFPVTGKWAFFDHAAVAPISGPARQAMIEWADDLAQNGDVNERRWLARIEEVRRLFGQLLHTEPQNIAFVKNTTEGIGFVAQGYPWRPGDNVITAAEEYPSNIYPWLNLASRGVEVRRIESRYNRIEVDDIRQAADDRTRLVSLSFVEFASGFRNNLDQIGEWCRSRGIHFFVDAIQGLGVLPLDVSRTPIDFLAADGHKWLLGPEGAGIFYIRPELLDLLHPVGVGWNSVVGARDFSKIDFHLKPHAGRWEGGSLNVAGITALGGSLELLLRIGTDAIARRLKELTDLICEEARRRGHTVFSSRQENEWSGIVSLIPKDGEPRAIVKRCFEKNFVINHRAGRLRLSPHCYNTTDEIVALFEIL
ncbi:MAG: cysteine desulfurase [Gemmatales bacterium]|nr:MAG: cysteine desulfurase [Gemmatales bacterium]